MSDNIMEQLQDFDGFFYYGSGDLEIETKSDILQNLMQSKRSLYYNRYYDSAGIKQYENRPISLFLQINIPYDIVTSIAKRNTVVSSENPDRRVSVSQSTIRIETEKGLVKVSVIYIPLARFNQTDQVTTLLPTNI